MSDRGGLVLLSSSSPIIAGPQHQPTTKLSTETVLKQKKKKKPNKPLEEDVLGQLAKCKISDDDKPNADETVVRSQSVNSTGSLYSSTSSGIGSGEYSPLNSGSISGKESSRKKEPSEQDTPTEEDSSGKLDGTLRRCSTGNVENEPDEIKANIDGDHHAKSLTFPAPAPGSKCPQPKGRQQNQKGCHLSPAEFFQMSRLRASALANKLNTTATFGGSKDLVTNVAQEKQRDKKTIDGAVEELTKAVNEVKLEKKEEKGKVDDGEGELVGRSPVPVYANNRHVQHPYKQTGSKYPTPQAAPSSLASKPNGAPTLTPQEFIQQQRQRAVPGQQYSLHQAQQHHQLGMPPQQQHVPGRMVYPHEATGSMVEDGQSECNRNAYSPDAGGYSMGQLSPCAVQQRYSNATPPAAMHAWSGANENCQMVPHYVSPMDNASPAQGVEDYQGNYPMVISPFEEITAKADDSLMKHFMEEKQQKQNEGDSARGKSMEELPEALSDFILKYSRRYSTSSTVTNASNGHDAYNRGASSGCVSGQPSPMSTGGRRPSDSSFSGSGDESGVEDDKMSSISGQSSAHAGRPDSCMSAVFADSPQPISATVPLGASPATPMSDQACTKTDDKYQSKYRPLRPKQPAQSAQAQQASPPIGTQQATTGGQARKHLREMISQQDFDAAWAWAMRCCQACPGSLLWRDADGDTLLHIVVWHKDFAKIYAITEILMKEDQPTANKPFDLPNKLEETPLFLAVEKRSSDVVAYLLECGANPNLRTRNHDGDGALHFAAARGMLEIVQLFCSSPRTNFNLLNGSGMTPLLCAVKNHGVIEEESQCLVNNKPTIRALLKAGADPKIPDVATGKSVLHYAVERMDPDLVELFRDHLSKDAVCQLVNMADYNGDTPLHNLMRMTGGNVSRGCSPSTFARAEGEEELRRKMLNTLIDCGADVSQCAGGLGDMADGSIVVLYPGAENDTNDNVHFTVLDGDLPPESF